MTSCPDAQAEPPDEFASGVDVVHRHAEWKAESLQSPHNEPILLNAERLNKPPSGPWNIVDCPTHVGVFSSHVLEDVYLSIIVCVPVLAVICHQKECRGMGSEVRDDPLASGVKERISR